MFTTLVAFVKDNWIKSATTLIGGVFAVLTGVWAIDNHYAKAADLDKVERKLDVGQRSMQIELGIQLNKQTIRDLQSKIGDIEAKRDVGKMDNVDAGKLRRYERDLADLKRETEQLERRKFQVESGR